MEFRTVLVERENRSAQNVVSSSALMINAKYVLTTSNIISDLTAHQELYDIPEGKLHYPAGTKIWFNVIWKESNTTYALKKANIVRTFRCSHIKRFCDNNFEDWTVDFRKNNASIKNSISLFLILSIEDNGIDEKELQLVLESWWLSVRDIQIKKCDQIFCEATPFGTRMFMNSLSGGIISNTLLGSHLLLSDCPTTPGCEGGAMYLKDIPHLPIGIILTSLNWWKKEYTGFTLIADIRPILCQMISRDVDVVYNISNFRSERILDTAEKSVAQINCGINWGSGVLLSREKGFFLTNSHVVTARDPIFIYFRHVVVTGTLIYRTPDDSVFDLAVIQCKSKLRLSQLDVKQININVSEKLSYKQGDLVYCAGFPLLSVNSKLSEVTITQGYISQSNPFMIKTTCGVYPGFSGGAVFNLEGGLLGIIVCNTKLPESKVMYSKYNMAIPLKSVSRILIKFIQVEDPAVLKCLATSENAAKIMWNQLEAKY